MKGPLDIRAGSLLTHSGSIHNKQDPAASVSSRLPLSTYTCSDVLGYGASSSSHDANITNGVTGNKRPVTRAASRTCRPIRHYRALRSSFPPSPHCLQSISSRSQMGLQESNVRVPASSQTRNEYEMIQRGCGKEKTVASRQTELLPL